MDTQELKEIVFREVKKRLSGTLPPINKNDPDHSILVVLNRIDPKISFVTYHLRELQESGTSITMVVPENIELICREEGLLPLAGTRLINENDLPRILLDLQAFSTVLFPVIGFSLAKRMTELQDDDPYVQLALSAILSGVNVGVVTDSLELKDGKIAAPGIRKRSTDIKKGLSALGIRLLDMGNLTTNLTIRTNIFQGKIVTEGTVKEFHMNNVWDINVPPGVVVTPLAKDKAKETGIRINRVE